MWVMLSSKLRELPLTPKPAKLGGNVGHINGKVSSASSVWFWLAPVTCLSTTPKLCPDCDPYTALRLDYMLSKTDCAQRVVISDAACSRHVSRLWMLLTETAGKKSGVSALSDHAARVCVKMCKHE